MKRAQQVSLAIACIATWAGIAQAQETINIAQKPLKAGEVVRMHTSTSTVGTMSGLPMGAATINMSQKFDQWMKAECLDIDADGVSTIRVTFERTAMAMTMGPITMSFDSADPDAVSSQPAAQAAFKAMGAMVGRSFTRRVDSHGKCLEVKGFREMMQDVYKNVPGGDQMAKAFLSDDNDSAMAQEGNEYNQWIPSGPVKVGDVWTSSVTMPIGPMGKLGMKVKNKLLGIETIEGRSCARVAMTCNMETDNSDKPMEIAGGKMKMHLTGTGGSGTWLWDIDNGRMLQMKQTTPMEMTAGADMPASQTQPAQSMQMKVKAVQTMTMEQIEGDPTKLPAATSQPAAETLTLTGMTPAPASEPAAKP